jgi:hypothetical protein
MFKTDKFDKKMKGFFSWTEQIDIEVKLFFAMSFKVQVLLQSLTFLYVASL